MPWKPSVEGEVPTLGYSVIEWLNTMLCHPTRVDPEPFTLTWEQEDFILRWFQLNPETGRFVFSRGFLGRPRGWGKSPFLGALCIAELCGPVLFAGWDASGQPVGRPWTAVAKPWITISAVSEDQTANTMAPLLGMLREDAPIHDFYEVYPGQSRISTADGGVIQPVTASASTLKGKPTHFAVLDQTEEWTASNGGHRLEDVIRDNVAKVNGRRIESPNAYIPGVDSVAERSANARKLMDEGKTKTTGLLVDMREAPGDTDLTDHDSLLEALRFVYGDSSADPRGCVLHDPPCKPGWVALEPIINEIWDPTKDVQSSRANFLNQVTHASDAWVTKPQWDACLDVSKRVEYGDEIVLGFDGSRGRAKGKADATALVGCRVSDGFLFEVGVWEQPPGLAGKNWLPPVEEVNHKVDEMFANYRVLAMYADPSGWQSEVAVWQAKYKRKLKVKASPQAPIAVWPRGKNATVVECVQRLCTAIETGACSHDGGSALTRHVLNARRRYKTTGYLLYKAFPDSPDKIDAAYAAVMAWKARDDALSRGYGKLKIKEPGRLKMGKVRVFI